MRPQSLLEQAFSLDSESVRTFREDGVVPLRGVLDAESIESCAAEVVAADGINVWLRSDAVRQLVYARRLARIAAELLGVRSVRLFHDRVRREVPDVRAEQSEWPLSSDRVCFAWVPVRPGVGPEFVLGKRGDGPVTQWQHDVGDVTYQAGTTLYRDAGQRDALVIAYLDADIQVREPVDEAQRASLRTLLPGATVGLVPDTPINPVLYRTPIQ